MTFEEMRITYQCPEKMARDVHALLILCEARLNREVAHRMQLEKELAMATAPRRKYRQVEEK